MPTPSAAAARRKFKQSAFEEAARDLEALDEEARVAARGAYLPFVLYTFPDYLVNWHHELLADALDRFARGEVKRLLIEGPPQATGKSELISRRLPGYIFGQNPKAKIITASHTADLAKAMSRDAQRVMTSPAYLELFPEVKLGGGQVQTDDEFSTPQGGIYKAVGVEGGIAGRPADFALIDDPLKGRLEANSQVVRKKAWQWLQDDVLMRLGAHGGCLIVSTRWHEDDPTGRVLKQMAEDATSERWEHVCLPARLDREVDRTPGDPRQIGDPLWPYYYAGKVPGLSRDEEMARAKDFLQKWETRNPQGFASLGQQRPRPLKGDYFDVEAIKIVPRMPHGAVCLKRVRYWDKAGSDKETAKRTAGVRMSKWRMPDKTQAWLVENVVKGRWLAIKREPIIEQTAKSDGKDVTIVVEEEGGSGGKESADNTMRSLSGFIRKKDHPRGDKALRAEPFAREVNGGSVYAIEGEEWLAGYLDELRNFSPAASLKDQVDASSGAFCELEKGGNWRALFNS